MKGIIPACSLSPSACKIGATAKTTAEETALCVRLWSTHHRSPVHPSSWGKPREYFHDENGKKGTKWSVKKLVCAEIFDSLSMLQVGNKNDSRAWIFVEELCISQIISVCGWFCKWDPYIKEKRSEEKGGGVGGEESAVGNLGVFQACCYVFNFPVSGGLQYEIQPGEWGRVARILSQTVAYCTDL